MWLIGKVVSVHEDGYCWEIIGIVETEEMAVAACLNETYFIGPMVLNEILPNEKVDWPGCYYPKGPKAQ